MTDGVQHDNKMCFRPSSHHNIIQMLLELHSLSPDTNNRYSILVHELFQ